MEAQLDDDDDLGMLSSDSDDDDLGMGADDFDDLGMGDSDGIIELSEVIEMLADMLATLTEMSSKPGDDSSEDAHPPEINPVIEEIGQRVQEPTGLSQAGAASQQLPQLLVTLLKNRNCKVITALTTATAVYVIWCSLANPGSPSVRREQRLLYEKAGVIPLILELLREKNKGYDRLMEHSTHYNCCCVLWNLSRAPELRRSLLVADVANIMIENIGSTQEQSSSSQPVEPGFDCDDHEGRPFFAGMTAANLVVHSVRWSLKTHHECSPEVQRKVIAVKILARRSESNALGSLSSGILDHLLGFLDDGWNLPLASAQLMKLGFPVIQCLERGIEIGTKAAGAYWHLSKEQSALDGLVRAIACLAHTARWCDRLLEQKAPQLLFRLLDPEQFNAEVQVEAAEALIPLLECARQRGYDVADLCKPSYGALVKSRIEESRKNSDKKLRVLLQQLSSIVES